MSLPLPTPPPPAHAADPRPRPAVEPDALAAAALACLQDAAGDAELLARRLAQAQARVLELEKRYADTIEVAAVGIAHVDKGRRLIHVNQALCDLLGYDRGELVGRNVSDISHPDDVRVTEGVRERLRAGDIPSFQLEKRYLKRDGTPVWVQLTISVQRDLHGEPVHDIAIFQDISARKRAEEAQRVGEERFRRLVELSSDWYWETDAELRFAVVGGRGNGARLERRLRGRRPWEIPGADGGNMWAALRERLQRREPLRDFEYVYADARGRRRTISVSGEPVLGDDGAFVGYRGVSRDITPRREYEERVRYLATHDSLTGLPNRAQFAELLDHLVTRPEAASKRFAVLFIDLDRFKLINDTLGHEAGDVLLRTLAQRLRDGLRSSDIAARLGGDEFVMLLQDLHGADDAGRVARQLLAALNAPVKLLGQDYRVTASIGVSMYPDDATTESDLMTHADVAMYHAKAQGRNNVQFYAQPMQHRSREQLAMDSRLRLAIEQDTLRLHYQPKVALSDGRVVGVEALLRWTDDVLGSVPPDRFIPLAEETGLILPIGRRVLHMACAQAAAWRSDGVPETAVAVNLSPCQLVDPALADDVRAALDASGLPAHLLELEVTENTAMQDLERALPALLRLRAMGVRLAVDDFGTGHSSLAQLKRFPIDTLKIDRSFVRHLPDDVEDRAIVEAVLALGRTLGLTVVAEGVETAAQQALLRALGCDQMQGFHFSRPLPPVECAALLRGAG